jgi:hypothetical protein
MKDPDFYQTELSQKIRDLEYYKKTDLKNIVAMRLSA